MSSLGTDVTARYPNARGTKKLVFRDEAGDLWVANLDDPETPLHEEPFKTVQQVSAALLRGAFVPPARAERPDRDATTPNHPTTTRSSEGQR